MTAANLGPKDVATALGCSERHAVRLMETGEIDAMRIGRPWRTSPQALQEYIARQFAARRRSPEVRKLEQTIVCMQELAKMGRLSADQAQELSYLEDQLTASMRPKLGELEAAKMAA